MLLYLDVCLIVTPSTDPDVVKVLCNVKTQQLGSVTVLMFFNNVALSLGHPMADFHWLFSVFRYYHRKNGSCLLHLQ